MLGILVVFAPALRPAFAQDVGVYPGEYDEGTFSANVHPDGSVSLRDGPIFRLEGLGWSFDVTDMIMRSRGEDPYASAKLRFLDQTRDERVAMGAQNRHAQLMQSGNLMRSNIAYVWATIPDATQRKQALFALWDECAESGDPDLVSAGISARAVAVELASQLQGKDAFTQPELDRLNAHRTSRAVFSPAGASTDRVAVRD